MESAQLRLQTCVWVWRLVMWRVSLKASQSHSQHFSCYMFSLFWFPQETKTQIIHYTHSRIYYNSLRQNWKGLWLKMGEWFFLHADGDHTWLHGELEFCWCFQIRRSVRQDFGKSMSWPHVIPLLPVPWNIYRDGALRMVTLMLLSALCDLLMNLNVWSRFTTSKNDEILISYLKKGSFSVKAHSSSQALSFIITALQRPLADWADPRIKAAPCTCVSITCWVQRPVLSERPSEEVTCGTQTASDVNPPILNKTHCWTTSNTATPKLITSHEKQDSCFFWAWVVVWCNALTCMGTGQVWLQVGHITSLRHVHSVVLKHKCLTPLYHAVYHATPSITAASNAITECCTVVV